jgi:hypothetical protein
LWTILKLRPMFWDTCSMSRREWRADALRSYATGLAMHGLHVPTENVSTGCLSFTQAIWAEIVFVAICQQTNFDLLHKRVVNLAESNFESITPGRLVAVRAPEAWRLLEPGLDRGREGFSERVRILRTLGQSALDWSTMEDLESLKDREVQLGGPEGLYAKLDLIPVFSEDPLRKKARVLVHQLVRRGLIRIADEWSLAPAIDYHLIRLYVRTGRVTPATPNMYDQLVTGRTVRVSVVTRLRRAVEEAMWHTAEGAGLRMDQLNHVEWQIARSFCVSVEPRCTSGPIPAKPVDRPLAELSVAIGGCPLSGHCYASSNAHHRLLQEPRLARNYY